MRYQPNRDYVSNDVVQTPLLLAGQIVSHFKPYGKILEPCKGEGSFLAHLPGAEWCEVLEGRDFFKWTDRVDWIVTNPPWSIIRPFLQHALKMSDNVVFLVTVNHVWTKARLRDIAQAGFGLKEIVRVNTPSTFPQSGFQLGAIHIAKGWRGSIGFPDITLG